MHEAKIPERSDDEVIPEDDVLDGSSRIDSDDAGLDADSPIHRLNVNQLAVEECEALLDALRERRLLIRAKIQKAAKVNTEKADLTAYLKFEKLLKSVKKEEEKLQTQCEKLEADVHKLRVLILEMGVD